MWLKNSKQSKNSFLFKDFHHHQVFVLNNGFIIIGRCCSSNRTPTQPTGDAYLDLFQNVFHHENFRGVQRKVVSEIAANKDILPVMPTGGGKSLCYWIPGLVASGLTVVITPIMALMNDQCSKLRNYGTATIRR